MAAEPPRLVVSQASDGSVPTTLTTSLEDADEGCIVDQRLTGATPGHGVELRSQFALLWLQRGLIRLNRTLEIIGNGGAAADLRRLPAKLGVAIDAALAR